MKWNLMTCGALVLGMAAGFMLRSTLESAAAIPPQTQAAAGIEVREPRASKPAVRDSQLDSSDLHQVFLRVEEKTATGYDATRRKEKQTELLGEPMHSVTIANMDFGVSAGAIPISATSRLRDERRDGKLQYAFTWDAEKAWFDYGPFKPGFESWDYDSVFHWGLAPYR
jgi:hypothetical protein